MSDEVTLKHIKNRLDFLKKIKKPVIVTINGIEIIVNPNVFMPATDSRLLASNLDIYRGQRFLDVCTGSGVIAIVAGLAGATGVAVDINPAAITNAKENITKHKVKVEVINSDVFSNISKERFDRIYANGPYGEGEVKVMLDNSCYGARNFFGKFFSGINDYLKSEGKALVVFPEWAEIDYFEESIIKNNLKFRVLKKIKKNSEDGERIYRLYEIRSLFKNN